MPAWIDGRAVADQAAVEAAGQLLGSARSTLVAGLSADVEAVAAAYRLAARLGASLDPAGSDSLNAELAALATGCSLSTTFAEAQARADCVLVVGNRPQRSLLLRPLLEGAPGRGTASARLVLSLGAEEAGFEGAAGLGAKPLAAAVALLRAVVGARLRPSGAAVHLVATAEALARASFGVVVYDPGELGELGIEMLHALVADLNEATRCTTLCLGDPVPGRTALAVGTWTTGGSPRVGLARGFPEHDPWRFDASRLVASGECQAALWLAALPCAAASWLTRLPTVALLGEATGSEASIVIAVAVPGLHADGVVWDERRATLCHRRASSRTGLAPAAAIVRAIEAAAAATRDAAPC